MAEASREFGLITPSSSTLCAMSMSHDELHIHPQFKPRTTYYNSFFLFRPAITIDGQLAELGCSVGTGTAAGQSELTLSCRYPRISVTMDSVFTKFTPILKKHGVDDVPNYWCDSEVPLFGVTFSQHGPKKLLTRQEKVDAELAAALSRMFSEQHRKNRVQLASKEALTASKVEMDQPEASKLTVDEGPLQQRAVGSEYSLAPAVLVNVHSEVFQIIPDVVRCQARLIKVTIENYMTCMTKWKESEVFSFFSLFQEHRTDPYKIIAKGTVTLKDLLNELSEVVNWFQMGVYLGVPEGVLMKIKYDCRNTDECMMHMLMTRMDQKELTWSDIVKALEMIKMRGLAQKIAVKYDVAVSPVSHDPATEIS